jgi:hypothetical protein
MYYVATTTLLLRPNPQHASLASAMFRHIMLVCGLGQDELFAIAAPDGSHEKLLESLNQAGISTGQCWRHWWC